MCVGPMPARRRPAVSNMFDIAGRPTPGRQMFWVVCHKSGICSNKNRHEFILRVRHDELWDVGHLGEHIGSAPAQLSSTTQSDCPCRGPVKLRIQFVIVGMNVGRVPALCTFLCAEWDDHIDIGIGQCTSCTYYPPLLLGLDLSATAMLLNRKTSFTITIQTADHN